MKNEQVDYIINNLTNYGLYVKPVFYDTATGITVPSFTLGSKKGFRISGYGKYAQSGSRLVKSKTELAFIASVVRRVTSVEVSQ